MSTKAKSSAAMSGKKSKAPVAKAPAGKPAKAAGKGPKEETKSAKGAAPADKDSAPPAEGAEVVDEEDLEDAAGSGGSSNDDAAAAASGGAETSASFKNFRHHPDMENFYRFIYENDLRHEAFAMINLVMVEKQARKAAKAAGKQPGH